MISLSLTRTFGLLIMYYTLHILIDRGIEYRSSLRRLVRLVLPSCATMPSMMEMEMMMDTVDLSDGFCLVYGMSGEYRRCTAFKASQILGLLSPLLCSSRW